MKKKKTYVKPIVQFHMGASETCLLCGKNTEVPISKPIGERRFYIEGAGQLCEECYRSLQIQY